jgi:MscS family membrane protein
MYRLIMIGMLMACYYYPLQAQLLEADTASLRLPRPQIPMQQNQDSVATTPTEPSEDVVPPIRTDRTVVQVDTLDEAPESETNLVTAQEVEENLKIPLSKIFWSVIVFIVGYFFIRFATRLMELFAERSAGHRITLKGIVPVLRIVGWIVVLFIIITGIIAPKIETIWALIASVGVAVGFASQDILKNIFGGVMILLDTPFKVGDKIEIGSFYGEVVEIGLRSTRIVTPDDSLVSIPNGEVMNQSVSNSNAGELDCQVVAELFLPLDIDTEAVRCIATEAAQTSRYVYLNKGITVLFFNEVKERRSYLKMRLKAYVMDIRYEFIFKSELTEVVLRELLREGMVSAEDF